MQEAKCLAQTWKTLEIDDESAFRVRRYSFCVCQTRLHHDLTWVSKGDSEALLGETLARNFGDDRKAGKRAAHLEGVEVETHHNEAVVLV